MAKESISITLDAQLKRELTVFAKDENRTISNLLEYILFDYLKKRKDELKMKYSYERARAFSANLEIKDYRTIQEELENNVHLTDDEMRILNHN